MTRTIALAAVLALAAGGAFAQGNQEANTSTDSKPASTTTPDVGNAPSTRDNPSIGTSAPRNSPLNPSYGQAESRGALFELDNLGARSLRRGTDADGANTVDAAGARDEGSNDSATGADLDSPDDSSALRSQGYSRDSMGSDGETRSDSSGSLTTQPGWMTRGHSDGPAPSNTAPVTGSDTLGVGNGG